MTSLVKKEKFSFSIEDYYIEHQGTGERMYLESRDGVYVLNTKVAPRQAQAYPFGGQGR